MFGSDVSNEEVAVRLENMAAREEEASSIASWVNLATRGVGLPSLSYFSHSLLQTFSPFPDSITQHIIVFAVAASRQRQTPIYFPPFLGGSLLGLPDLIAAALFLDTCTNRRSNSNTALPAGCSAEAIHETILARQPELNWKRERRRSEKGATFGQGRSSGGRRKRAKVMPPAAAAVSVAAHSLSPFQPSLSPLSLSLSVSLFLSPPLTFSLSLSSLSLFFCVVSLILQKLCSGWPSLICLM